MHLLGEHQLDLPVRKTPSTSLASRCHCCSTRAAGISGDLGQSENNNSRCLNKNLWVRISFVPAGTVRLTEVVITPWVGCLLHPSTYQLDQSPRQRIESTRTRTCFCVVSMKISILSEASPINGMLCPPRDHGLRLHGSEGPIERRRCGCLRSRSSPRPDCNCAHKSAFFCRNSDRHVRNYASSWAKLAFEKRQSSLSLDELSRSSNAILHGAHLTLCFRFF